MKKALTIYVDDCVESIEEICGTFVLHKTNKDQIKEFNAEIKRLSGVIEGLKFAIRCNGVSGGEVR